MVKIALNVAHQANTSEAHSWWKMADRSGVDVIALADSPTLMRDVYVHLAVCAGMTKNATLMTGVTNPISRDPSVTACALFTLNEIAPGRIVLGIGSGDSAIWGIGRRPSSVARMREYILAVKAILAGQDCHFEGRTFKARWANYESPVHIPVVVAVSGPKTLRMACEVADGALLSMGCGSENITYINGIINDSCAEFGRSRSELDLWWNSEIVFGDSYELAKSKGIGVGTNWLTMGTLEGKQIPNELKDAVVAFNNDSQDIESEYQTEGRETALIHRAKKFGIYDWLMSRAPGLWGPPELIAKRLLELESQGLDKWMFYVGRNPSEQNEHIRLICEEVLPRLKK